MTDIADIPQETLMAELQRRAALDKLAQYAPLREAYEPLHGFMDNEEPLTLSQLIVLLAASRPQADPDSPMERNLDPLRRVLTSTKTVWDNTVGIAFDAPEEQGPA